MTLNRAEKKQLKQLSIEMNHLHRSLVKIEVQRGFLLSTAEEIIKKNYPNFSSYREALNKQVSTF